jgi:hypothetical protein
MSEKLHNDGADGTSVLLLCLASLAAACGQTVRGGEQDDAAGPVPFGAPLSTRCAVNETDWLGLDVQLPGRWTYGGSYMEVGADLEATWGRRGEASDRVEGRSVWARDADGLVEEVGAGPCLEGSECGAAFVRRGTTAVDANELAFYALWPLDPCQAGVTGRYEGRERFENNRATGGELRTWSERSERLTLNSDGTWLANIDVTTYASVNDRGTVYWLAEPRTESGQDQGAYRQVDGAVSFTRRESATGFAWIAAEPGQSVELWLIGRALSKPGVSTYRRN